jgi:hypothetical protein
VNVGTPGRRLERLQEIIGGPIPCSGHSHLGFGEKRIPYLTDRKTPLLEPFERFPVVHHSPIREEDLVSRQ